MSNHTVPVFKYNVKKFTYSPIIPPIWYMMKEKHLIANKFVQNEMTMQSSWSKILIYQTDQQLWHIDSRTTSQTVVVPVFFFFQSSGSICRDGKVNSCFYRPILTIVTPISSTLINLPFIVSKVENAAVKPLTRSSRRLMWHCIWGCGSETLELSSIILYSRSVETVFTFKTQLKTQLFRRAFLKFRCLSFSCSVMFYLCMHCCLCAALCDVSALKGCYINAVTFLFNNEPRIINMRVLTET